MVVITAGNETIAGVVKEFKVYPPFKIMAGSEELEDCKHTVIRILPATYYPENSTLIYYRNVTIQLGVINVTEKKIDVKLEAYPNVLALPEGSEGNITLKVYNSIHSIGKAMVNVTFQPSSGITFYGQNMTNIVLGTAPENYSVRIPVKVEVPNVTKQETYYLNVSLEYFNGTGMSVDKYVIPIVVYPIKFVDVEVVDVDVPTKMFVGENYTIKAKIRNSGSNSVILLPVRLFFDELQVSSMNVPRIDPGQELTVEITLIPTHASKHNVTVALPLVAGESIVDNNVYTVTVDVMAKPIASFTYTPTNPTTADVIQFTDQSYDLDGNITAWHWDFGDGTTSNDRNPTHKYAKAGTYTVTLTVTDNDGNTNSTSRTIVVREITTTTPTAYYYGGGGGYIVTPTPTPTPTQTPELTPIPVQTPVVTPTQTPTTPPTPAETPTPEKEHKWIPGFVGYTAVVSLILALLVISRRSK
jgi:PKD repeat protein